MSERSDKTLHSLPQTDSYGGGGKSMEPPVDPMQLTKRDLEILKICQIESFRERCLPLMVLGSGLTHFAVKSGHLTAHPRVGSFIKVSGAALMGFVLGKVSYGPTCRQKMIADPASELGRRFRVQQGIAPPESEQQPPGPQGDSEVFELPADEHSLAKSRTGNSYDDLRKRNRGDTRGDASPAVVAPPAREEQLDLGDDAFPSDEPPQQTPAALGQDPSLQRRRPRTNVYGDVVDS